MKKSIIRAFIFSFIVLIVISFLSTIIGYSIAELIDLELERYGDYPAFVPYRMISPMGFFPWELLDYFADVSNSGLKLFYMGLFLAPIIASIIAGLTGGDIVNSVAGWILTSITCMILFAILFSAEDAVRGYYCFTCTTDSAIVRAIVHVLVNLMIFGALTAFIALIVGRSSSS
jgi:hypothetical protein